MEKFSHIDTWVFDLDNTLYDAETGVFTKVSERIRGYVSGLLHLSPEEAAALQKYYWKKYGTTLRGLMTEHKMDPRGYLDYVHDIDISYVPQCAITKEFLPLLPGKKIIFTNSDRKFSARMMKHLGIDHHFDHVFAIEDADYVPKPHPDSYHAIIKKFSFDPKHACMFEDMEVNLKTADDLGMTTVWLHGKEGAPDLPHIHHRAEKLSDWLLATAKPPAEPGQHTVQKR